MTYHRKKIIVLAALVVVLLTAPLWAVFCPQCGQDCPEEFKFCPRCGADLSMARQLVKGQPAPRVLPAALTPGREQAKETVRQPGQVLVDLDNFEVVTDQGTFYAFQVELLADMFGRPVSARMDHLSSSGKKYMIYTVANLTVERYEDRQHGKWQADQPRQEGDFAVLTKEGISMGMSSDEVRALMRNSAYMFSRDKTKKRTHILVYKRSVRWSSDLEVEFYFSAGENKLERIRFGLLSIN